MLRPPKRSLFFALVAIGSLFSFPLGPAITDSMVESGFGDPLSGLSPDDLELFDAGKEDFLQVEEVIDGLGPGFNARSCGECHSFPTTGGGSAVNEVRFGRNVGGIFDPLASKGGSLLQLFAIEPKCQEVLPHEANKVGGRQTTALFGAGLVEAIPDGQILNYANYQHVKYPFQAGRPHMVTSASDGQDHVGRFGWKAQQALLLDFSGDAYLNEMGITNFLFPLENAPNGDEALLAECDTVDDPEDTVDPSTGRRGIDNFTNFMRFLAPPPRGPITTRVLQGEALFHLADCTLCHRPSYTAVSSHSVINGQMVNAFSDFLLHDIGTGDGIALGNARPNEFRTAPLWGLRVGAPYLHDGSAATPLQAILAHGKQADSARRRFERLSADQQGALLAFLNSL
jgi:CxxC motif-containing protein (DUF1111 family)